MILSSDDTVIPRYMLIMLPQYVRWHVCIIHVRSSSLINVDNPEIVIIVRYMLI